MPLASLLTQASMSQSEPVWMYAHPSMYELAGKISSRCDLNIAKEEIQKAAGAGNSGRNRTISSSENSAHAFHGKNGPTSTRERNYSGGLVVENHNGTGIINKQPTTTDLLLVVFNYDILLIQSIFLLFLK